MTLQPLNQALPIQKTLEKNTPVSQAFEANVPVDMPYTQPYWLVEPKGKATFNIPDQKQIGLAELPPPFTIQMELRIAGETISFHVPVLYRWVDPTEGERYKAFTIAPEVSVALKDPNLIFASPDPKPLAVTVTAGGSNLSGSLQLRLPEGWKTQPETLPFKFENKGQTLNAVFQVSPGLTANSGAFAAVATLAGKTISVGSINIDYPHITPQVVLERAEGELIRLNLKKNGQNLGYVMGSGDPIPEALRQVGYRVTLLSDDELASVDLSPYAAVIVGIRAYNTRPALKAVESRLLEYVKQGGTMVVQYNILMDAKSAGIGPYPFRISRDRVSVEDSPVTISSPAHRLLNYPNKITPQDFDGWVQERGLYFSDQWDPHYETILSCNDPGESAKPGGLLFTRFGKGVYIYTGYSWFRQLPAGVPGAYRLFVNLISAGSKNDN
jgi:hypothetical protein